MHEKDGYIFEVDYKYVEVFQDMQVIIQLSGLFISLESHWWQSYSTKE